MIKCASKCISKTSPANLDWKRFAFHVLLVFFMFTHSRDYWLYNPSENRDGVEREWETVNSLPGAL